MTQALKKKEETSPDEPVPPRAETLAEILRGEIITEKWGREGQLPPEKEFLTRFAVSRPTYREALRLLESQGLIRRQRGSKGGARIFLPDIAPIATYCGSFLQLHGATGADIFQARLAIEPVAVRLLAARCNVSILAELGQSAAALRFYVGEQKLIDAEEMRFRKLLLKYCGNVTLNLLGNIIGDVASAHAANLKERYDETDRQIKEQKAGIRLRDRLLEALSQGNGDEAERLWMAHLKAALRATLEVAERAGVLQLYVRPEDSVSI